MPSCHVCKGESFTIDAGFSYCDDCGTQAQHLQELEYDTYFDKLANRLTKTAFKAVSERHGEFVRQNKKKCGQQGV